MNNITQHIKHVRLTFVAILFSSLSFVSVAQAQVSGGILGIFSPDESAESLQADKKIHLRSVFRPGSPEAVEFLKSLGFDGGDGPDYITPIGPGNALVGSDAADSLAGDTGEHDPFVPKFDGSDGPDYITPIGPGNALVGSDAADSLVGSDAADSLVLGLHITVSGDLIPLVHELNAGINALLSNALAQLPLVVGGDVGAALVENLNATGNEVAIFEEQGVSLKGDANEVAITSLDDRTLAERWEQWNFFRGLEKESLSVFPVGDWADDVEALFVEWELGILSRPEFENEVAAITEEIFLLNGLTEARVTVRR